MKITSTTMQPDISNDAGEDLADISLNVDVSSPQASSPSNSLDAVTSGGPPATPPTISAMDRTKLVFPIVITIRIHKALQISRPEEFLRHALMSEPLRL